MVSHPQPFAMSCQQLSAGDGRPVYEISFALMCRLAVFGICAELINFILDISTAVQSFVEIHNEIKLKWQCFAYFSQPK